MFDINLVKVVMKPNRNIVKVEIMAKFGLEYYTFQAHIVDVEPSENFNVYEIPLRNFKAIHDPLTRTILHFNYGSFRIIKINVEVESKEEKEYEIELKEITVRLFVFNVCFSLRKEKFTKKMIL